MTPPKTPAGEANLPNSQTRPTEEAKKKIRESEDYRATMKRIFGSAYDAQTGTFYLDAEGVPEPPADLDPV